MIPYLVFFNSKHRQNERKYSHIGDGALTDSNSLLKDLKS